MRLHWLTLLLFLAFLLPVVRSPLPDGVKGVTRWAALLAVTAFGLATTRRAPAAAQSGGPTLPALVMLAVFALASWDGVNPKLSFMKMIPLVAETVLALAILPRGLPEGAWLWLLVRMRWVLTFLCAGAAGAGFFLPGAVIEGVRRLGGISNPNSVGVIAMLAALMWLWRWGHFRLPSLGLALWLGGLGLSLGVLWWTGSRACMAGFVAGFVAWAWLEGRSWRLAAVGILAYSILHFTLPAVVETSSVVVEERIKRGENPWVSRENVWNESLESWKRRPWLGYGYGISATAEAWEGNLIGSVGSLRDGSGYLGVLESVGVIGLLAFAVLMATAVAAGMRVAKERSAVAGAGLSLMAGLLVNAAAEPWLLGPGSFQQMMLWLAVGQTLSAAMVPRRARAAVRYVLPSRPRAARPQGERVRQ